MIRGFHIFKSLSSLRSLLPISYVNSSSSLYRCPSSISSVSPSFTIQQRTVSQSQSSSIGQDHLLTILKKNFPIAKEINVHDISGGCGAMFEVYIKSEQFKGMSKVKQHLAVSKILQNEIKNMHGIRIFTEDS